MLMSPNFAVDPTCTPCKYWRRGRDLNPRYPFGARFFSKEVHSATLPPLQPDGSWWYLTFQERLSKGVRIQDVNVFLHNCLHFL